MMQNDLNILVSGASVSGLSVAYWLSLYGFKVTVVERAPQLRPGGQALDVRGAAAVEIAERMGILATIRERSTKLAGMSMVDATGKETFRSEERSLTGGRFDSPNVEILRDHLVEVLYETVRDQAEFIFDDSIASLSQDDAGVDVAFVTAPPQRFDLVIGADGVRSNVRRLAFGPDERFIRYLGSYIAVFSVPNFLGLDHWQVFCQDGDIGGGLLVMAKDDPARTYLGFNTPEPLAYDYRDVAAQKQLLTDRITGAGWVFPQILAYMQDTPDFYFDSINQIRMDHWSDGRVVLLGDAGYAVSLSTGQGTSVAMVAAYVLAGELATHKHEPLVGLRRCEDALRDYVIRNQALADQNGLPETPSSEDPAGGDAMIDPDSVPDYNERAIPFDLKSYQDLIRSDGNSSRGRSLLTLRKSWQESGAVHTFSFSADSSIFYRAGQYAHFTFPWRFLPLSPVRKLSFASAPGDNDVRITVDTSSGSKFQQKLLSLAPGQKMTLFGIHGNLVFPKKAKGDYVFIAGGIGMTPFRSLLRDIQRRNLAVTPVLIHVARASYLYEEEFRDMPFEQHRIGRGEVDSTLSSVIEDHAGAIYFIAGSPQFVQDVTQKLRDRGIRKKKICGDKFTGLTN